MHHKLSWQAFVAGEQKIIDPTDMDSAVLSVVVGTMSRIVPPLEEIRDDNKR